FANVLVVIDQQDRFCNLAHLGILSLVISRWTSESPGRRALQCLLKRHARAFQARILGSHQPNRNAVKVTTHVALVAKTLTETAAHEEFREARHYAASDIYTATRSGGQ